MIKRRRTRRVKVGGVTVGGDAAVSIQSMTNTVTADVAATVRQINRLEKAGCEIVRVAVKDASDADAIKAVKRKINIPLVCDIHFNYMLALKCIESGADKVRLNPGNIRKREYVEAVVRAAKKARIPIRIGVNSGSISASGRRPAAGQGEDPAILVRAALGHIKILEAMDFHDIIVSLKSSDVLSTVESYRKMSALSEYPLHIGVTATGPYDTAIIKSSVGIGALLAEGIGDTVRVSLTADPVEEVSAARKILQSLALRNFGPDIISCPTCGRCKVDLIAMAGDLEKRLLSSAQCAIRDTRYENRPLKIALMGCEVNGPGEAKDADLGIAFGKESGILFRKGKIIRKVRAKDAINTILKELRFFYKRPTTND